MPKVGDEVEVEVGVKVVGKSRESREERGRGVGMKCKWSRQYLLISDFYLIRMDLTAVYVFRI